MPDGNMTASPSDKTVILAIILILPPGGRLRPKKSRANQMRGLIKENDNAKANTRNFGSIRSWPRMHGAQPRLWPQLTPRMP
ncbi:hypothetical protein AGR4C_Lc90067 [Agrobacterium tumefaciens str. Kerr 14]|uniref:Uncharacterized protein n=1 Tax=Agrobacterium tumefaciens str. Kerr 14 TaxID=1183424 RepID=A0A1S7S795_AGRTU|nr:hypothetical protein AGR4C_Lc90067 [Agrobacterium tumefaciens str. Kerr 14]